MYQVSERYCPACFRFLRIMPSGDLYCPDQLRCRWFGPSAKGLSAAQWHEQMIQAQREGKSPVAKRAQALLKMK